MSRQIFFWHYFCFWVSMDLVQNLPIKIKKLSMNLVHDRGSMDPVRESGPWTPGPCFVLTPFYARSIWKGGGEYFATAFNAPPCDIFSHFSHYYWTDRLIPRAPSDPRCFPSVYALSLVENSMQSACAMYSESVVRKKMKAKGQRQEKSASSLWMPFM